MKNRITTAALCLIVFALSVMSGCVAADKVAEQTHAIANDPAVKAVVESTVPFGGLILAGVNGALAVYLGIRKRAWKTAFTTVVNSVEPYIPADEVQRTAIQARQGPAVTSLVKQVKG